MIAARGGRGGRTAAPAPRIVLIGLDGVAPTALGPETTPFLWGLATAHGGRPARGRAPFPATTHPSFATLLTGARPGRHAVRATATRPGARPGWAGDVRVAVPTLLDACEAAGIPATAILGDHELLRVLGAERLPRHWPPGGDPAGLVRDAHGYPVDDEVAPVLVEAAADPAVDVVFGHLNEADTVGHDRGPGDPATAGCLARTDAIVKALVGALRPRWRDTLLVVVSDHGMIATSAAPPIDPSGDRDLAPVVADWLGDGGAALLRLRPGSDAAGTVRCAVERPGIASARILAPDLVGLGAAPGRVFAGTPEAWRGCHGGPGTRGTLAIVAGGHPAAARLRAATAARPPAMADWAPTLAALIGVSLPDADGTDLLGRGTPSAIPAGRRADRAPTAR